MINTVKKQVNLTCDVIIVNDSPEEKVVLENYDMPIEVMLVYKKLVSMGYATPTVIGYCF
jgi:hypothetical protein